VRVIKGQPAVWIVKARFVSDESFQPLLWGLEEEGVPYEVRDAGVGSSTALAKQAADSSPLNVGICVGGRGEVILHHQDLPEDAPLFKVTHRQGRPFRLLHLGINAARLVKRQPLVLGDKNNSSAGIEDYPADYQDKLTDLVNRILDEMSK
jgi:hypothetical protein